MPPPLQLAWQSTSDHPPSVAPTPGVWGLGFGAECFCCLPPHFAVRKKRFLAPEIVGDGLCFPTSCSSPLPRTCHPGLQRAPRLREPRLCADIFPCSSPGGELAGKSLPSIGCSAACGCRAPQAIDLCARENALLLVGRCETCHMVLLNASQPETRPPPAPAPRPDQELAFAEPW